MTSRYEVTRPRRRRGHVHPDRAPRLHDRPPQGAPSDPPTRPAAACGTCPARSSRLPASAAVSSEQVHTACSITHPGWARCLALYREPALRPLDATPAGYGPADLRSAYVFPATGGAGQTVAIVDAYDDPNAEADLGTYRTQYGLAALHDGERVLPQGQSTRRCGAASGRRRRMVSRDRPRPGHGVGRLPGLPHPARRGR